MEAEQLFNIIGKLYVQNMYKDKQLEIYIEKIRDLTSEQESSKSDSDKTP